MFELMAWVFLFVVGWLCVWQLAIWAENAVTRFFAWRRRRRRGRAEQRARVASALMEWRRYEARIERERGDESER
jgi:hypothetical protein